MAGKPTAAAIGPSHHYGDDVKAAVQSAVNCYPAAIDGDRWMQESIPGEVQLIALGAECRGSHVAGSRWFVAAGSSLYELFTDGTSTVRGALLTSSGFVGMDDNQTQLAIVDGPNLYVFTLATNAFTQVTVAGWRGSNDVHEMDGYFVFVDPDTDQFYLSAIDDGTALDALDFSSADSSPDNIIAHAVSHRQLWLFGALSAEIWINSGSLDFPFVRYQSYTLDVGVVGPRAVINAADTLVWIGKTDRGTGIVYMAVGNQPQRISNTAVERALKTSTNLSAATMWVYQVEGHEFVGINAPGMDRTWVWDAATKLWHERGEWAAGWSALRARLHTAFNDKIYAMDSTGYVVRLDSTVDTLNGRVLKRERTWPHSIQGSMEPLSYRCLELALKSGSGGSIALQISNDGGFTFGPPLVRSLGVVGRWMQRVRWMGLGTAINRVFRVWQTDAVPFVIHAAVVEVD